MHKWAESKYYYSALRSLGGGVFFSSISIMPCAASERDHRRSLLHLTAVDRVCVCVCVPIWEYCNFMCCSLAERKINMQIRARRHIFSAALNSLGFVVRKWWISLCARRSFAYAPVCFIAHAAFAFGKTHNNNNIGARRIMHLATQIISRYQTNTHVNLMVHWVRRRACCDNSSSHLVSS
jgi:hypothetical protein